ncbi:MAG: DUF1565 domain-containing protein [Cyanobacteriota bacterium]|nr:DUF1565 domain-containing protein [Cyanobacteriota bacterium]
MSLPFGCLSAVPRLSSLILLAGLLGLGSLPALAQTTLDATLSGQQAPVGVPPLPNSLIAIFVDATNGSDTSGDGSQAAPYQTITYAVERASAGSLIQLLPGSYTAESGEVFPIKLKAGQILRGDEASLGEGYLISGGGSFVSPTLARQTITMLAETGSEIRGVTMRNEGRRGYALWLESTSPKVYNNSFVGSIHDGIFMAGSSSPWVEGNRFYKNGANGISVLGTSAPTIVNNLFQETGFGITIDQKSTPQVKNNRIVQNRSGVIVGGSAQPILRNNTISQNLETGLVAITKGNPDLGTAGDAGNNVFQGNGQFDINNSAKGILISANGNQLSGLTKGDIDISGQATVTPDSLAAPAPIAEGSLTLPSLPAPAAVAANPAPQPSPAGNAAPLPSVQVPISTAPLPSQPTPAAPANPTPPAPLVNQATSSLAPTLAPADPSNSAVAEFKPVPFTPEASPPSLTQQPTPAQSPLLDITTLKPRPQPAPATVAPPPPTTVTTADPTAVAVNPLPNAGDPVASFRFRILVTPNNAADLAKLQQLVPEASETSFNGRNIYQAGTYQDRATAQAVLEKLQDAGFEALAEMVSQP